MECLALRNEAWPRSWVLGTLEFLDFRRSPNKRGPLFPPGRWFKNQGVPRLRTRFTLNLVPDPSSQTRLKVSRPISLSERPAGPWILPKVAAVQQAAVKPTLHRQIWDGHRPTPRAPAGIPHPSSRPSPLLRPPTEPTPTAASSTMATWLCPMTSGRAPTRTIPTTMQRPFLQPRNGESPHLLPLLGANGALHWLPDLASLAGGSTGGQLPSHVMRCQVQMKADRVQSDPIPKEVGPEQQDSFVPSYTGSASPTSVSLVSSYLPGLCW